MQELLLVLLALLGVGLFTLLTQIFSVPLLMAGGFLCLGVGISIGFPVGAWYHVLLYRALLTLGPVPPRWWLSPSDYHSHLPEQHMHTIRPWYLVGAASFACALAGGLAAMAGLLLSQPG